MSAQNAAGPGAGSFGPNITGSASLKMQDITIAPPRTDGLWSGLRWRDAIEACELIRENLFLMEIMPDGTRDTVRVRTMGMKRVEAARLPPPRSDGTVEGRWDLVVNGVVIDPRRFAILYDERIFNLGALYTYAREFYPSNQAPQWELPE